MFIWRAAFIKRVRDNARLCAEGYLKMREKLGYPLLKNPWTVGQQPEILDRRAHATVVEVQEELSDDPCHLTDRLCLG
jgi:hypothetical protein